ncbi:MAG: terpene cyclase/mutase family protein [Planctomycetes bacterium]|nr:terpene cyclase/mutase family protein [Planctomycetota bacterium]
MRNKIGFILALFTLSILAVAQDASDEQNNPDGGQEESPEEYRLPEGYRVGSEHDDARFVTPAVTRAVEIALGYLSRCQHADGSIVGTDITAQFDNVTVAITALAGLAFAAGGNLPDTGEYGNQVRHAIDYLISVQSANGYIAAVDDRSRIHGHGFATLLLAEIYGSTGEERIRIPLQRAVEVIENSQTREGGWGYDPDPNTWDEASTTICVIQALRSASEAGIVVKDETIERATDYVHRCSVPARYEDRLGENKPGKVFRYSLSSGNDRTTFALTAAAVSSLQGLGEYEGEIVEQGLGWLDAQVRTDREVFPPIAIMGFSTGGINHFWYAHFYASQALFHAKNMSFWEDYYPKIRNQLLRTQRGSGAWDSDHGPAYSTSIGALILQIPYKYLPIFQR